MFIQVIEGRTSDSGALQRQLERWQEVCAPGAVGYLGSTAGITTSGDAIVIARFESEQAAQANSARPEQSAWWAETESFFDGPVRFHDTTDVSEMRHGDPDAAGFVQIMEGHISDRARADALEAASDQMLADLRPDLLGTTTAFFGDGEYAEVAYFTSEQAARRAESLPMPEEAASLFADWEQVMKVDRYVDLTNPILIRA